MSDKWETVVAPKRKPKQQTNGQAGGVAKPAPTKPAKAKKFSAKTPVSFPGIDFSDLITGPDAAVDGLSYAQNQKLSDSKKNAQGSPKKSSNASKGKKESEKPQVPKAAKRRDLESSLSYISASELLSFFDELQNAGSAEDVCLSWIKYCADALNTKLSQVIPPEVSQWPNDLEYPRLPTDLEKAIKNIITQTTQSRTDLTDILGISFSSLLASIPTLIQRGDPGWGYLLFLREICRLDPSLPSRRWKTITELMESYGNKKEIGLCVLWTAAQAGVDSPYVLKIASQNLLPYYGFKHYKVFVLAALGTLATTANMAVENLIDADEFEEFFEASFDPKKRRELEKIYPRIKELVLKGKKTGSLLFLKFFQKVGKTEFLPLSPYGKEVFDILHGCLENDSAAIDTWRDNLSKYPKESTAFLHYLSKIPESVKCSKRLETKLIQSDQFAVASVKSPELLRIAKKLQTGIKRAEASKKWFSWKLGSFLVFAIIAGLLWLDVSENGKGVFEKSNTGKLLQKYGLLEQTLVIGKTLSGFAKVLYEHASVLFRSIYEGVRPVLQSVGDQVQVYIPQLTEYLKTFGTFVTESISFLIKFLLEKVFVGVLSPENLRKFTKEWLSFIWSNIIQGVEKLYEVIEKYIK